MKNADWGVTMAESYRIKKGVVPYGGRVLEPEVEREGYVTGYVRLSFQRYATSARTYRREELEAAK